MALLPQVIPLSLGIGLDTKTDPKQVVATKLTDLQNVVFGTGGEFKKRNGHKKLYPSQSAGTANAIASFQNQLVKLDGFNLSAYSEKQDTFNNIGVKTCVDISTNTLSVQSGQTSTADLAYLSGLYGVISQNNHIMVIDEITGQTILNTTIPGSGFIPNVSVQALGTKLVFVYSTGSTIGYVAVDVSTPSVVSAPVVLQTDFNSANGEFDCRSINGNLVFAYLDNTNQTSCFYLSSALVKSATFKVNVKSAALGIFQDTTNNVWVLNSIDAGAGNFTVNYFILNPTITGTILGQTNIDTFTPGQALFIGGLGGVYDGTNGNFYYTVYSNTAVQSLNYVKTAKYSVAGTAVTAAHVLLRSVSVYSRPFIYSNRIFVVVSFVSALQNTYFLLDQDGIVTAKFSIGNAAPLLTQSIDVSQIDTDKFTLSFTAITQVNSGISGATNNQAGVLQVIFDFGSDATTSTLGKNLLISGGVLSMYDGMNCVEHGFNVYPILDALNGHTTGGNLSAGTYEYRITYEWTDAQGQLHRSAPTIGSQVVTTTGLSSVDVVVETLKLTQKENVYIVIYRTTANGTQLYQVTPVPSSGNAVLNDKTVDTITFTDTISDSNLISNIQLYTNGGEFENIEIPATKAIWQYQNRLLGVYSEQQTTIGFSKQVIGGQFSVPVEFNDSFTILAPENDGVIVSGIQMDDKCIIFKKNTIYFLVGQGPSANGQNNDFSTPQVISTDCGCVDKKSVVLMPDGVMFKSSKGIYLLDRSLQVHYIGADVEGYNSYSITSVQMVESVNQIRFTLDSGISIVYDYYYKQWGTFTNISAVDSCIFQNKFTYLNTSGFVFQETPGIYTDDGAFIPISFTTAWFSFAKIQGFQRALRMLILGEYISPHTLKIDFSVNFDPTIVQTSYIPVLSSLVPYQNRVFLDHQKCQSYRLKITEQQSGNYGEGLSLSSLTFEVGAKKGLYKLPAANSYG